MHAHAAAAAPPPRASQVRRQFSVAGLWNLDCVALGAKKGTRSAREEPESARSGSKSPTLPRSEQICIGAGCESPPDGDAPSRLARRGGPWQRPGIDAPDGKSLPFRFLKRCQTALKTVKTAPFPPFSVPCDTVSDGETVSFRPSGASMRPGGVDGPGGAVVALPGHGAARAGSARAGSRHVVHRRGILPELFIFF